MESESKNNSSTKSDLNNDVQLESAELSNLSTKRILSWPSVLFLIHLNTLGFYAILILLTNTYFTTAIFTLVLTVLGILGATAGAHRLWAHHTYKANTRLRLILMLCQTLAGQGSIYNWVQQHRLHHKTFKTDDDIFYSNRDFWSAQFFAQIHTFSPKQEKMLKEIDMSDLEIDGIVMFQKKFYWPMYIIFCILLPLNAPMEYWDENLLTAVLVTFWLRYMFCLNICWLINSAHFIWGQDKNFKPADSNMIFLVTKSYWPLYHYMLPSDYQTGEFGDYGEDFTTTFIRVFAAIGWAIDLQMITCDAVRLGLTKAVDNDRPIVECIKEAAKENRPYVPRDYYFKKDTYL